MSFQDFQRQEKVVELLQRTLCCGRLAHAYLFSGPVLDELEGVARTLAKTLNCLSPPRRSQTGLPLDSCDTCSACRRIEEGNFPDVSWLRPESKSRVVRIEQIRDLLQSIYLKPMESGYKVAVIVAADRLNVQAANAFLKTLEEPPDRSVLILLTSNVAQVLETLVSRCLRLTFTGDCRQQHPAHLVWLGNFSETAAAGSQGLLARYRLLGLLLQQLAEQKSEIEKTLSAQSPLERYDEADSHLREKWEDELSAAVEAEYRRQRSELLATLQWWLRDVWLHTEKVVTDLANFPELGAAAATVAQRLSSADALGNLEVLEETQRFLGTNVQEALILEVGLLKLKL